jgi:hypothetical protein
MALGTKLGIIASSGVASFTNTYSFEFDGVDDRVQLGSDFTASGTFTISFWMKPAGVGVNGKQYVMGTFPGNSNFVKLSQLGVIYLKVNIALQLFNEGVVGGGANNLVLDEWQHIAFIRDSSNVISCYRNGSSFGGTTTNSNTLTLNSFGRIISSGFGFEGGLDEIALFNTDQTSNLATIYNSGAPNDLASLSPLHWYRMGDSATWDGSDWTLADQGSGGVNGTSVNMTESDRVEDVPS